MICIHIEWLLEYLALSSLFLLPSSHCYSDADSSQRLEGFFTHCRASSSACSADIDRSATESDILKP